MAFKLLWLVRTILNGAEIKAIFGAISLVKGMFSCCSAFAFAYDIHDRRTPRANGSVNVGTPFIQIQILKEALTALECSVRKNASVSSTKRIKRFLKAASYDRLIVVRVFVFRRFFITLAQDIRYSRLFSNVSMINIGQEIFKRVSSNLE